MSRFMRGEVGVLPIPLQRNENLISACPCGGIGRRVGLKIQSGFTLGASSSLAKGNFKRLTCGGSFFSGFIILRKWRGETKSSLPRRIKIDKEKEPQRTLFIFLI